MPVTLDASRFPSGTVIGAYFRGQVGGDPVDTAEVSSGQVTFTQLPVGAYVAGADIGGRWRQVVFNVTNSSVTASDGVSNPETSPTDAKRDYGATGDGTTDDTTALQAAFDGGDDVYLSEGTYIASSLTLTDTRLYGPGTLKWKDGAASPLLTVSGTCYVEGITFDGVAQLTTGVHGVVTSAAPKSVFSDCTFKDFPDRAFVSDVASSPDCKVRDCNFTDCDGVALMIRSPDWQVRGGTHTGGGSHCIRVGLLNGDATTTPVRRTIIAGVTFRDSLNGVVCEIHAQHTLIEDCTFENLSQAVKCEDDGGTVFDTSVLDNVFRNMTGSTCFNLTSPRNTFSDNTVESCVGGVDLGDESVCTGNRFESSGFATSGAIRCQSTTTQAIVTENLIVAPTHRGIEAVGGNTIISLNYVLNAGEAALHVTQSGNLVTDNVLEGGVNAFSTASTLASSTVKDNRASGQSGSAVTGLSTSNSNFNTVLWKHNEGFGDLTVSRTIATDAVTIGPSVTDLVVDTEGAAAADDLATINGGYVGQIIVVRSTADARVVTVKDATGNINLAADFVLNSRRDTIPLIYTGATLGWLAISAGANNA